MKPEHLLSFLLPAILGSVPIRQQTKADLREIRKCGRCEKSYPIKDETQYYCGKNCRDAAEKERKSQWPKVSYSKPKKPKRYSGKGKRK